MIYKNLTAKQKKKYLADSSKCPYCGSSSIEGSNEDDEGDDKFQNISCDDCGREWVDIYKLAEVDDGEQLCAFCGELITPGADVFGNGPIVHSQCNDNAGQ